MHNSLDPLSSDRAPADQRPPKLLRALMGLALLGLMAGLVALILSLAARSSGSMAPPNQDAYPPAELTASAAANLTAIANTTETDTYPDPQGTQTGSPPALTTTPTMALPPIGAETLTPTPFLLDPGELTPNPAFFTPAPSFTPLPTLPPASFSTSNWCVSWNSRSQIALVQRVIDGATIEIEVQGQPVEVRYIGVELPDVEGSQTYEWALRENRRLVEGKWATLIQDYADKNEQGQWMRYVLAQGVFVNHELIRQGYLRASSFPPDVGCDAFFFEAQQLAQAAGLGIWTAATPTRTMVPSPAPPAQSGDVQVVFIHPKGEGWQDPNEFAEIRNLSAYPVQLAGWTLSDEKGHKFVFPDLLLNAGGYCRIYTNQYVPEACGLSFYSLSAIWDDAGDCAYLRDPQGNLVSQFCY